MPDDESRPLDDDPDATGAPEDTTLPDSPVRATLQIDLWHDGSVSVTQHGIEVPEAISRTYEDVEEAMADAVEAARELFT